MNKATSTKTKTSSGVPSQCSAALIAASREDASARAARASRASVHGMFAAAAELSMGRRVENPQRWWTRRRAEYRRRGRRRRLRRPPPPRGRRRLLLPPQQGMAQMQHQTKIFTGAMKAETQRAVGSTKPVDAAKCIRGLFV